MPQQINLFSPVFLRKKKHFSAKTMAQALGVIAVSLVAFYGYARYEVAGLERIAAESRRQLSLNQAALVEMTGRSNHGAGALLQAEATRLEGQANAHRQLLSALQSGELGNDEGFSSYFAAFARQTIKGVWLTGFAVGESGNELSVEGRVLRADLVPAYLKALNREEVMRGRKVSEMKLWAKAPGAPAPSKPAASPERYIEFSIHAPRVLQAQKEGK